MTLMPLEAAFEQRTRDMHHRLCQRLAEKRFKKGPRKGKILRHAIPFSVTLPQFRVFILDLLGGNRNGTCFCYYCSTLLDAMNIGLDHEMPLAQGGSAELINLKPCCPACNRFKGNLTPLAFAWLKRSLIDEVGKNLTIADSQNIVMRLKSGGGFFVTKKKVKGLTEKLARAVPVQEEAF